ncbi:fluoride efflux transporter CrcB [Bifidobacterium magnum]|uniref:Fluoride-specific ion channel FluC n=1 Tax=Bifidobacterium magnum TaxID=1692 RepID=A0A087BC32_9BIFI|nr:fluoride efflux transporter CrcB [Bifidobacterium magnum]KFI68582.1 CrcB-like protein [Bifidobacterium magnum]
MALLINCIFVGLGGCAGSIARYLICGMNFGKIGDFSLLTLFVNVLGSFIIGFVAAIALNRGMDPRLNLVLKTGFCGGFTTFSTFSLETFTLLESNRWPFALLYIVASVVLCVLGVMLGTLAGKAAVA